MLYREKKPNAFRVNYIMLFLFDVPRIVEGVKVSIISGIFYLHIV